MTDTRPDSDLLRLLRIAALLWIAYLLALAAIGQLLLPQEPYTAWYYAINIGMALLVLAMSLWTRAQAVMGRGLLPLVIVLMSAVPIIVNYETAQSPQLRPRLFAPDVTISSEEMALRLLPMLFIALALVAWQYRWRHVVAFTLGIATLNLVMLGLTTEPGTMPFFRGFVVALIQIISFLMIGYFISFLMGRLHAQNESLQDAHAQLRHYASTLESLTVSRERNRMARELHDTLAHTLSGLSVQLETVKAYWSVDPAVAQTLLDQSLVAARSGLQETRRALKSLRASPLDDLGLTLALRRLAESAGQRGNLTVSTSLPDPAASLSPDVEQCIYRVVQEAIANALHHANARCLDLRLTGSEETGITLVIHDDGKGFERGRRRGGGPLRVDGDE